MSLRRAAAVPTPTTLVPVTNNHKPNPNLPNLFAFLSYSAPENKLTNRQTKTD